MGLKTPYISSNTKKTMDIPSSITMKPVLIRSEIGILLFIAEPIPDFSATSTACVNINKLFIQKPPYNGRFPCFLVGSFIHFSESISKADVTLILSSEHFIISSISPLRAALTGEE